MSGEARTDRLAGRLPSALSEGRAVRGLLGALAQELGGAEQGVMRVMRARHLHLADSWWGSSPPEDSDLGRLGALVGLRPLEGEQAGDFRKRVLAHMAVHRAGLGTAEAVLQLAGLALRCEGPLTVAHLPRGGGWVSVGTGRLRTLGGRLEPVQLELIDNPPRRQIRRVERWAAGEPVVLDSLSVAPVPLTVELRALEPVVAPMLRCGAAAVVYAGEVPAGATLTLRPSGALVDGWVAPAPLLGAWVEVLDGGEGPARYARPYTVAEVLQIPPGESRWTLGLISPGAARALAQEQGRVCALAGEDTPCAARPSVDFGWEDQESASFVLRFLDIRPAWAPDRATVVEALQGALDYGRAAGVQARLQLLVPLTDAGVVPEDRLPVRARLGGSDGAPAQERVSALARFTIRERYRTRDQARPVGRTRLANADGSGGSRLDRALLGRADDARFGTPDAEGNLGVRLDVEALDEADAAVFGATRWDEDALALAGRDPGVLALHPDEAPHPTALAVLAEAGAAEGARWGEVVLGRAAPARFLREGQEERGLVLDGVALGFGLPTGVLGHARFGRAGLVPPNPDTPPEGWPLPARPRRHNIEIEADLASDTHTDTIESGEDNGG